MRLKVVVRYQPTFIGTVYEFRYLLLYLHYRSIKGTKFMKGRKWHEKLLAGRARLTILLQRNPSYGEMLDQVHFSFRSLC